MTDFNSEDSQLNREVNSQQLRLLLTRKQMDLLSYIKPDTKILQRDSDKIVYLAYRNPVNKTDPIIIKATNSNFEEYASFNEAINEAFVGDFGVNNDKYPNFVRILGYEFKKTCNSIINKPSCDYIAYEYIEGVSLASYISHHRGDRQSLIKIIRQIFVALRSAYKDLDFVHYDLHLSNVMIKPDGTPVIIDYGRSHIRYQNKDYGMVSGDAWVENKGYWQYDCIFFLMYLINWLCPTDELMKYVGKVDIEKLKTKLLEKSLRDLRNPKFKNVDYDEIMGNISWVLDLVEHGESALTRYDPAYIFIDGSLKYDPGKFNFRLKDFPQQLFHPEVDQLMSHDNSRFEYYAGDYYSNMNFLLSLLKWLTRTNFQFIQRFCQEVLTEKTNTIDRAILPLDFLMNNTVEEFDQFIKLFDELSS